jgi:DNA repair protein RadC
MAQTEDWSCDHHHDIAVLDHVTVAGEETVSFAEGGML